MSEINTELINTLKKKTSEKENTVDLLMDIIPIGKEAAYRRLRGEIPFSLEEAIAICRKLNISLDVMAGTKRDDIYAFHSNAVFSDRPIEEYSRMMSQIIRAVESIKDSPGSKSYRAQRTLPQEFLFRYESLAQIYIRILFYQLHLQLNPKSLLDIEIPHNIFVEQKKMSSVMQDINSVLILDKGIFQDYIEIVKYFQGLGMVNDEDIAIIKRDMSLLLDDMERCASSGMTLHKKKLDMYISHISFDCTYTYIEGPEFQSCSVGVYCIDHLSCDNDKICKKHKSWIKSLVRFSTLISVSGELQRNEYFSQQRDIVKSIL
ncbi:hypothetical protein GGR21_002284 [Dysgonomonas hofstadii]|uniref:Transcription regulator BetR N-terminal domain-containing protein n=1 Tax=Dysgonomonas hofstadii TaxID=637886 RepID=A0A840CV79_9BACT|nr:hypothetical protein [Dysgonomonas hofstadii]MBB4036382.1 hypothetical protein [Dysgonomonas hofstadii]